MTATKRLSVFAPSCLLMLCGFAGIVAPRLLPSAGERVAVIAPGADALTIVAAAGGSALAATDTGIIAVSNEPGFVARLYHSGAWLVVRFDGLLGCLDPRLKEASDNERG